MRLDDAAPNTDVRSSQLAVGVCGQTSVLHATWVESHKKTDQVLYTRRVARPGYSWSRPLNTGLRHPEDFWSWSWLYRPHRTRRSRPSRRHYSALAYGPASPARNRRQYRTRKYQSGLSFVSLDFPAYGSGALHRSRMWAK